MVNELTYILIGMIIGFLIGTVLVPILASLVLAGRLDERQKRLKPTSITVKPPIGSPYEQPISEALADDLIRRLRKLDEEEM